MWASQGNKQCTSNALFKPLTNTMKEAHFLKEIPLFLFYFLFIEFIGGDIY